MGRVLATAECSFRQAMPGIPLAHEEAADHQPLQYLVGVWRLTGSYLKAPLRLSDCFRIHPHQLPHVAVQILEGVAVHEAVILGLIEGLAPGSTGFAY